MSGSHVNSDEDKNQSLQFEDYQIHSISENHPLKKFLDEKTWPTPCLLVSKHIQDQNKEYSSPRTPSKDLPINESFDGSPLKLQKFNMDSSFTSTMDSHDGEKMMRRPVHVRDARLLLSQYNLCASSMENSNSNPIPMWVICDGKDKEHCVLLGSRVCQQNNCTQFIVTNITVQGQVLKDSMAICQTWVKRPQFCQYEKDRTTKCFAKYTLYGSESQDEGLASDDNRALEVHFHWNRLTNLLQMPPVDARISVKASVAIEDPQSAAHFVFAELCILKNLANGISGGSVEWSSQAKDKPLLARVKTLIRDSEMTYVEPKDSKKADDTIFIKAALNRLLPQREEFEFTEELWLVLKDCTCFQDLMDSIQCILTALQRQDFQPVVHRDNKTMLGELIHDSYNNKMTAPSLEGGVPLEMLVEIGIEKMCNDYTYIFLDFVTMASLEKFVQHNKTMEERLESLFKLHRVLELMMMLERLELPNIVLGIAARMALKYYETNAAYPEHTFTIPVPNQSALVAIDKLQLIMWQADISTTKHDAKVRAMYMFTEKPPFDHVQIPAQEKITMMPEDVKQYYLTYLMEDVITFGI